MDRSDGFEVRNTPTPDTAHGINRRPLPHLDQVILLAVENRGRVAETGSRGSTSAKSWQHWKRKLR